MNVEFTLDRTAKEVNEVLESPEFHEHCDRLMARTRLPIEKVIAVEDIDNKDYCFVIITSDIDSHDVFNSIEGFLSGYFACKILQNNVE